MLVENVLVVCSAEPSVENQSCIAEVKRVLEEKNIMYEIVKRDELTIGHVNSCDLVVSVGGDGTFIKASHFILDKTPILGVNSNPEQKEGFYLIANKNNFREVLERIVKGKYKIVKLHRLKAFIEDKRLELALNEVFFGHVKPYKMSRYDIRVRRKEEFQKSSGVIISTASGSHAWLRAAGGKKIPVTSSDFCFVVREPHSGRLMKPKIKRGVLSKKETIELTSRIHANIAVVDSLAEEVYVPKGKTLIIGLSDKPLHAIRV